MTLLIHFIPGAEHIANVSMLYLLVVIGAAVGFGSGPAVTASVLAFMAFDWFFVDPRHTFTVSDPAEWIALLAFLVTAVVTGQLTSTLQVRAEEARQRERETAALAEASWAVAAQVEPGRALAEVLHRLSEVVSLEAASLSRIGTQGEWETAARFGEPDTWAIEPASAAVQRVIGQGRSINWDEDPRHWQKAVPELTERDVFLPLRIEHRVLGVLWLRRTEPRLASPTERRVVESLARHAAIVLERERLTRAEMQARALAEADRLKTALLSMVSHDFRSPLTAIKATVTSLQQEGTQWEPEVLRELHAGIELETDRLNRMVGNILALSRLEADAWRPRSEATPPAEWIGTTLGSFTAEENARIRVDLAAGLPEVNLDPVQMVQVLRNLLDNALKYSPRGSTIELHAGSEGDKLVVEVADRGMGLPPGEESRIFEPFYRAPHLRESAVPGVGIGLAVCKGLVEAHHGLLTARTREGGGSVFRIELPLEDA